MTQSPISNPHFPDLYALIIKLTATQNGRLRATQGHLAHAAFLNIVQQVDPTLSEQLHEMDGRKPFTLSPLQGFGHGHKGQLTIGAGQSGWLRLTLLDPQLFQTFIRYFLEGSARPTLRLERMLQEMSVEVNRCHARLPPHRIRRAWQEQNGFHCRREQEAEEADKEKTIELTEA